MIFDTICPPAIIYIFFSLTHIIIDTFNQQYNTAFLKLWVATIITILLNYLCSRGLGVISWLIVFIPFILMTFIITILLYVFGLDPKTGRLKTPEHSIPSAIYMNDPREEAREKADKKNMNKNMNNNKPSTNVTPMMTNGDLYFDNYNDSKVNTIQLS